jgi:hypothetical protein
VFALNAWLTQPSLQALSAQKKSEPELPVEAQFAAHEPPLPPAPSTTCAN